MELEKVTAEIRPRSEWEAIDLGVSLARRHVSGLFKGWVLTVLPACLLITLACLHKPGWAIFAIWWLKPLFERSVLFELSRELFGEKPTPRGRLKSFMRQLRECWLLILLGVGLTAMGYWTHDGDASNIGGAALFWFLVVGLAFYRSLLNRSLTLPVRFLEGLRGANYRKRTQLLSRKSSGAAGGLTVLCLLVEWGLVWSLANFIGMMLPTGVEWSVWEPADWAQLTKEMFTGEIDFFSRNTLVAMVGMYFITMSITAWLYVGGGFGLYVNTRTWTEGWDIELNFKRIGQRLAVILTFLVLGISEGRADSASERMSRVLEHEDFTVHKSERKRWVSEQKAEEEARDNGTRSDGDFSVLMILGKMVFWVILIAVVVFVIWIIARNRHFFAKGPSEVSKEDRKKVMTVAGLEVTPESLPADVLSVARNLWNQGQQKDALGLLYRGAISWVITQEVAEIAESDTEMDCVRRVNEGKVPDVTEYFQSLTHTWMGAAYGGVFPEDERMERIWSRWPFSGRRNP